MSGPTHSTPKREPAPAEREVQPADIDAGVDSASGSDLPLAMNSNQASATEWQPISVERFVGERYRAIWGSADDDIWLLGEPIPAPAQGPTVPLLICPQRSDAVNIVRHFDGNEWRAVEVGASNTLLSGIDGSAPDDVWIVGTLSTIWHWDGVSWTQQDFSAAASFDVHADPCGEISPLAVSARARDDVWVVGSISASLGGPALVLHFDGSQWTRFTITGGDTLLAVHAISASDVWAVDNSGYAFHFDGKRWRSRNVMTEEYLVSLWAGGSDDIWAAGNAGTLIHFDGSNWKGYPDVSRQMGTTGGLTGSGGTDVWAASSMPLGYYPFAMGAQQIMHWDGEAWSTFHFSPDPAITDFWTSPSGQVWAVGSAISRLR